MMKKENKKILEISLMIIAFVILLSVSIVMCMYWSGSYGQSREEIIIKAMKIHEGVVLTTPQETLDDFRGRSDNKK